LHILILEAYDGGSHKQFLDGLIAHSRHEYTRIGLPARKWKWRMRGSAIYFAEQVRELNEDFDLIFTSDMCNLAELRSILPARMQSLPVSCYFHENQLTYPLPDESQRDYQYAFTNITSCLAADEVWFNSDYHYQSFMRAVDGLLRKMPDYVPKQTITTIRAKSKIMPLGLSPQLFTTTPPAEPHHPPTVLWNHRWEYDKNPDDFFETLFDLDRAGVDFRLHVAGETFREAPPIFAAAQKILSHRIDHFGYIPCYNQYLQLLADSDIVISTAIHEFFGLSVLEAIAARCYPLLPNRLSYPELIPEDLHLQHIYQSKQDLAGKLQVLLQDGVPPISTRMTESVRKYSWDVLIDQYDDGFEKISTR
jgi:glycosyltransferase involved in cell wall biosynthesis